ncbi:MAG TPA: GntR family transcriptional regulator [Thermoanaerobaculia bacterium]|nr:GntR family transcriptional regulator [Thermoanaerobaculia bacterium]
MPPPPITIDARDPTPLYAQLDRAIRVAIATGKLAEGDRLPTVRQLAVDLRVNANTVAKVYLALERERIVETKRGVGTFVVGAPRLMPERTREKQLRAIAQRYLSDAALHGASRREAVEFLVRLEKEGD